MLLPVPALVSQLPSNVWVLTLISSVAFVSLMIAPLATLAVLEHLQSAWNRSRGTQPCRPQSLFAVAVILHTSIAVLTGLCFVIYATPSALYSGVTSAACSASKPS